MQTNMNEPAPHPAVEPAAVVDPEARLRAAVLAYDLAEQYSRRRHAANLDSIQQTISPPVAHEEPRTSPMDAEEQPSLSRDPDSQSIGSGGPPSSSVQPENVSYYV